jgi:hypothetical protein
MVVPFYISTIFGYNVTHGSLSILTSLAKPFESQVTRIYKRDGRYWEGRETELFVPIPLSLSLFLSYFHFPILLNYFSYLFESILDQISPSHT